MRLSELSGRKARKYTGVTGEDGIRRELDPPADSVWEALGRAHKTAAAR